jgi:hypothetical protein
MLTRLSQAGITPSLSASFAKRLKLTNTIAIMLFVLTLLHVAVFSIMGFPAQATILAGVLTLLGLVLWLNIRHLYLPARILLALTMNGSTLYYALAFGDGGLKNIFFFFSILPWYIFSRRELAYTIGFALMSIACYMYAKQLETNPLLSSSPAIQQVLFVSGSVMTFSLLFVAISTFRTESDNEERYLKNMNAAMRETEQQLQQTLAANSAVVAFTQAMYNNGKSIEELCDAGLRCIMDQMNCTYGAVLLYDKRNDVLTLQSESGFDVANRRTYTVKPGETLTGDAFVRQRPTRLKNVAAGYWHMQSGLGAVQPRELHIVPMTFKAPAGVLEVAFIKPPDEDDVALLHRLALAFAAHILSLEGTIENDRLIAELQQQKNEVEHSYRELETLKQKAAERMQEQYTAQQTLIKQILDKGKKKEEELMARIEQLEQQSNR